jgi:acetyl-CoA carboxylase carboxyltransferase component
MGDPRRDPLSDWQELAARTRDGARPEIDAVIDPADTRQVVVSALGQALAVR